MTWNRKWIAILKSRKTKWKSEEKKREREKEGDINDAVFVHGFIDLNMERKHPIDLLYPKKRHSKWKLKKKSFKLHTQII